MMKKKSEKKMYFVVTIRSNAFAKYHSTHTKLIHGQKEIENDGIEMWMVCVCVCVHGHKNTTAFNTHPVCLIFVW